MLKFGEYIAERVRSPEEAEKFLDKWHEKRHSMFNPFTKGTTHVPLKNAKNKWIPPSYDSKTRRVENVPYHKLHGTQKTVMRNRVRAMIHLDQERLKPITVVKHKDGRHEVIDGHHTLTSRRLRGYKEGPAVVYDAK